MVTYASHSTNKAGFRYQSAVATASTSCDNWYCILYLSRAVEICDEFYYGTGTNTGQSSTGGEPGCDDGTTRLDAWGIMVHELGHWKGLGHNLFGTCVNSRYSPAPTYAVASMCFSRYQPATQGGSGSAGVGPRRTISQDEIQGARYKLVPQEFVANHAFTDCTSGGCAWGDATPDYWMTTPSASRWWGSGYVSLNNNSAVPYPEIYQRVRGADADSDNDGVFQLTARVKAVHSTVNPRAVVFIRHVSGANELKCNSGTLTVGVWTTVSCQVNLVNSSTLEFEYGVRVTEKINIDWVTVADK